MVLVVNADVIDRNTTISKYKFWLFSTNNFGHIEAKGKNVQTRMIVKQFRYLSQEDKADNSYVCIKKGIVFSNKVWLAFLYVCASMRYSGILYS